MTNTTLQTSKIAKAALAILSNELSFLKDVHRPYDDEYTETVNGYTPGDTISIRRPAQFTVRTGANVDIQDVTEGKETLTIDTQKGIDFQFTSKELTLDIRDLSERVIRPAMTNLVNDIAKDCMDTWVTNVANVVGTPGTVIDSYSDYLKGVTRLNEAAAPMDSRCSVLSPSDWEGLVAAQAGLFSDGVTNPAIREADVGRLAQTKVRMSQIAPVLTTGSRVDTNMKIDGTIVATTSEYDDVKNSWQQTIHMDGFAAATQTLAAGDVFTISGVYDVNPVTKARLSRLKQFTVKTAVTAAASEGDVVITPPILWAGAQQNVDVVGTTDLDNLAVSFVGTASTVYQNNVLFHKNAFTFAMVPMISPPGAVDVARESMEGISVRLIPGYTHGTDVSAYRLDVLYGKKTIDNRLATRLFGT